VMELKPCPFCGESIEIDFFDSNDCTTCIRCENCGAMGPWVNTGIDRARLAAQREWNKRKGGD